MCHIRPRDDTMREAAKLAPQVPLAVFTALLLLSAQPAVKIHNGSELATLVSVFRFSQLSFHFDGDKPSEAAP